MKLTPSTRNQSHNVNNFFQRYDKYPRVLAVCSAGLLRSASINFFLTREFDYNVRNCGITTEYALIPITEALIEWADHIVFAEQYHYEVVAENLPKDKSFQVLDIPDIFEYRDPDLLAMIKERFTIFRPSLHLDKGQLRGETK